MSDVTNARRARWAEAALDAFALQTGLVRSGDATDRSLVLGDLLCDLMHYSDEQDMHFNSVLEGARRTYADEVAEETQAAIDSASRQFEQSLRRGLKPATRTERPMEILHIQTFNEGELYMARATTGDAITEHLGASPDEAVGCALREHWLGEPDDNKLIRVVLKYSHT